MYIGGRPWEEFIHDNRTRPILFIRVPSAAQCLHKHFDYAPRATQTIYIDPWPLDVVVLRFIIFSPEIIARDGLSTVIYAHVYLIHRTGENTIFRSKETERYLWYG